MTEFDCDDLSSAFQTDDQVSGGGRRGSWRRKKEGRRGEGGGGAGIDGGEEEEEEEEDGGEIDGEIQEVFAAANCLRSGGPGGAGSRKWRGCRSPPL